MFNRRNPIEEMFEAMQKDVLFNMGSEESPFTERRFDIAHGNVDGYRAELIDGELTEYVYEDGEWQEVGLDEEDDENTEVVETEDGATFVADVSTKIEDNAVVSGANFNNGILEVDFESRTATEDQESSE